MGLGHSKKFQFIKDTYETYEQVQNALLNAGIENNSNLILGIDLTQSNETTGRYSFRGKCLHQTDVNDNFLNPYQEVMSIIGKSLDFLDKDRSVSIYGFGDSQTKNKKVLAFDSNFQNSFEECMEIYKNNINSIRLSGPTSFAPIIYKTLEIITQKWGYYILVIIADGQVTEPTTETDDAIRIASHFPLSIIVVGVGDGPWKQMEHYDDNLRRRKFDNFQFVEFNKTKIGKNPDINFAISALQEVPYQYQYIKKKKLLNMPKKLPKIPKIGTVLLNQNTDLSSSLPPPYLHHQQQVSSSSAPRKY
jgi:hypothetical protein